VSIQLISLASLGKAELFRLSSECHKFINKAKSGKMKTVEIIPFLDKFIIGGVGDLPITALPEILEEVNKRISNSELERLANAKLQHQHHGSRKK
jgi:hypothetical protein